MTGRRFVTGTRGSISWSYQRETSLSPAPTPDRSVRHYRDALCARAIGFRVDEDAAMGEGRAAEGLLASSDGRGKLGAPRDFHELGGDGGGAPKAWALAWACRRHVLSAHVLWKFQQMEACGELDCQQALTTACFCFICLMGQSVAHSRGFS